MPRRSPLLNRLLTTGVLAICWTGVAPAWGEEKPAEAPPVATAPMEQSAAAEPSPPPKRIIGPIAVVQERLSGVRFRARVDTGAKSCSLHVEEIQIHDASDKMRKNIGKQAKLRVVDPESQESHWIEAKIAKTVIIMNSAERERRYKVWLTLQHNGFDKRVSVTINDRSNMDCPMLLGRNYLHGDYLVDVAAPEEKLNGAVAQSPN